MSKLKLVGIVCLFLVYGCIRPELTDPRVTFIDSAISRTVRLTEILPVVGQDGHLTVQVTGFNDSFWHQKLQYRIQWFDQNGLEIPAILTRWVDFPAFKNSAFNFQATAPSKNATSFKILIRETD